MALQASETKHDSCVWVQHGSCQGGICAACLCGHWPATIPVGMQFGAGNPWTTQEIPGIWSVWIRTHLGGAHSHSQATCLQVFLQAGAQSSQGMPLAILGICCGFRAQVLIRNHPRKARTLGHWKGEKLKFLFLDFLRCLANRGQIRPQIRVCSKMF